MDKQLDVKMGDIISYISRDSGFTDRLFVTSEIVYNRQYLEKNFGKIIKVERPVKYETIYEVKEILDDVEKKWLGSFIKPFKNRVLYIGKRGSKIDNQWLAIGIKNEPSVLLPFFKANTMYKNMELDKDYKLEELGL